MRRDVYVEARLLRWAEWRKVGDGSGYSRVNVLHPSWSPPAPGVRPAPRVANWSDAKETERAVRRLSQRLQDTLVLVYCRNLSRGEQAERLGCAPGTVTQRIAAAHRELLGIFAGTVERGAAARAA